VSVRQLPNGQFQIDWRDQFGRRKRLTVESERAAYAIEAEQRQQAASGRAQLAVIQTREVLTLLESWEKWNATRFVTKPTKYRDTSRCSLFLRTYGREKPAALTPQILAAHLAMRAGQLSPGALYQEGRALRNFFAWCLERLMTSENPLEHIKLPQPRSAPGLALSDAQIEDLLRVCPRKARVKVLLAVDAGLARADVALLQRGQVNLEERVLRYHRKKNGMLATVPLTPRLHAALADWCGEVTEPSASLFNISPKNNPFTQYIVKKLPFYFRTHDLRHTFASRVARTGARNRVQQALMGHTPTTPGEKYDHPDLEELRATISAMERRVRLVPQDKKL
jgi:integrase